jgi:hypothetical protein
MQTTSTDELPDVLATALTEAGRTLDDLTVTEAVEIADALWGVVVAALPAPTPRDASLAASLTEAAELIERRAGIA